MKLIESYAKLTEHLAKNLWIPLLIARLGVGFVFAQAGWGKLHSLPDIVEFFTSIHIPHPEIMAPFVGTVEFVGGLMIMLGLLTRLAALPLIGTMIVAIITVKSADFKEWTDLFGDSDFLYAMMLFVFVFAGAGCVSADHFLFKMLSGPRGPRRV